MKALLIAALAFVLASALVTIGSSAIQSAQACPNKSSDAAAPNVPNTLDTQPRSQLATSQSA
jgi:hypothetical protein